MNSVENSDFENAQRALQHIHQRIAGACERAGREPSEITLIGASKTVSAAKLQAFFDAGLTSAGENYVQEGIGKIEVLGKNAAQWHLIGALQSNKARETVANFGCVHSVDRASLATALNRECEKAGRTLDVLLQVNVGGESSKAGCEPEKLGELFNFCRSCKYLQVCGLMGLPPFRADAPEMRNDFRVLRELLNEIQDTHSSASTCRQLSMGMSNDFEVAIEEGATMIRIGTALFGGRA